MTDAIYCVLETPFPIDSGKEFFTIADENGEVTGLP